MLSDFSEVVRQEGDLLVVRLGDMNKAKYFQRGDLVELGFNDGRTITPQQRRMAYALIGEVDRYAGNYDRDYTKAQLKTIFSTDKEFYDNFSLATCSITVAGLFINFLIEFCLAWDIGIDNKRTLDEVQGQYGWEMSCLKYKRCCICGKHADIAHVQAVGMGRNRKKIDHTSYSVMPLCRIHHTQQHTVGITEFMSKYHISGVKVTPDIAEMLKLGDWQISQEGSN